MVPGKQPARRKPSRLRHEIRPDSTDDERDCKKHVVHIPDSDIAVPQTQIAYDDHASDSGRGLDNDVEDGEPLSPGSAAVLERNLVTKKTETPESNSYTFKLLSKEVLGLGDTSASSSPSFFSFTRTRKAPSKTPPKEEVATLQSTTHVSLVPPTSAQREEQVAKADGANTTAASSHLDVTDNGQQDAPDALGVHDTTGPLPSLYGSGNGQLHEQIGRLRSGQLEAASGPPSSAQSVQQPVSGVKKIRIVKRGNRAKKGLHSKQRGGPWPPRSSNTIEQTDQTVTTHEQMPETFADPHDVSQVEPQDDWLHTFSEHDGKPPPTTHDSQNNGHSDSTPQNFGHENAQHHTQPSENAPGVLQTMFGGVPGAPAQSVYQTNPEHTSHIAFNQSPLVKPKKQTFEAADVQAVVPLCEDNPSQHTAIPALQTKSHDSSHQVNRPIDNGLDHTIRSVQPRVEIPAGQHASQRQEADAILRGISDRGGVHRVGKPRKTIVAVNGNLSHGQGPSVSLDFESSLGNLRLAIEAEKSQMQYEHTTALKRQKECSDLLRELVGAQAGTIANWKQKHHDLAGTLTRVTEKAKTNQRYVTGLQNDYEKLQKSFTSFYDENKKTLQAKIAEIEKEKDYLRREFDATIEKMVKSQRNLKSAVEDLYVRFVLSDSKRKDLAENLCKQEAICQEERQKRNDLEKQLLSGVESMQRQFRDSSTALINKIDLLQASANKQAANDDQDAGINECLSLLRKLQSTPFLTAKAVQKAEGMLRFINERMDSGFSALSAIVKCKPERNTELQDFIKQQLQCLQTEMGKYEDVVAENRKEKALNENLKKRLEAQEQHSSELEEQIKALQKTELDIRAHSSQLQSELHNLGDISKNSQTERSEVEQGMADLREQLRKAEEYLQTANANNEKAAQVQKSLQQEGAKYKVFPHVGIFTAHFSDKPQNCENDARMREKITQDFRRNLTEKEDHFKSEFCRLKLESEGKEQLLQNLHNELHGANDQLEQLSKRIETLESDLHDARKEQLATEAKLKVTQQASPLKSTEMASLKEQLRQQTEELESRTRAYAELERQCANANSRATDIQASNNQLQAQVSQQLSAIENMRQETDRHVSEAQQDAQSTIQLVRDKASILEQEKQNLLSGLEQARANEAKLNNALSTLSVDEENMRQQLAELRTARDAKDADIARIQADAAEQNRELAKDHSTEIYKWSRRLTQTDAALKEAEARSRLVEDQFQAKIAADRKLAEEQLLQVEHRYQAALQAAEKQINLSQGYASQSSVVEGKPRKALQNIHSGDNRKKVNRQNHSVLNIVGPLRARSTQASEPSPLFRAEVSQIEEPGHFPTLFEENARAENSLDEEDDLLLVGHRSDPISETQDVRGPSMLQEVFDEKLAQASHYDKERHDTSSTGFTSIASEELTQMHRDTQSMPTTMLRGRDHSSSEEHSSQKMTGETLPQSDSISMAGSGSSDSHDRPRSQANTASRMMPPPDNGSHHVQSRNQIEGVGIKTFSRDRMIDIAGARLSSSGTSTPDFVHPPSSASRQTYSKHDLRNSARDGSQQRTSRGIEQRQTEKRKCATERDTADKKQRTSSQSHSVVSSSSSRKNFPYTARSPDAGPRSNKQTGPAYSHKSSSAMSNSKNQASSSSSQTRTSAHPLSSSDLDSSRRRMPQSSQMQAVAATGRTSSRLTRSKSMYGTG
ncbi:hypothetical protein BDW02DRAFT_561435 [Decorospora gaudefroyi]|uniref:Uncharacterized protein n=1 Tax=Decorospora gaudefroyi TaxID=184978 RepID=A0A6A5JX21_9PLEO|nr:hypothetical protein BDW02DRAFT_561435 [Decorospora gaudefroyi]